MGHNVPKVILVLVGIMAALTLAGQVPQWKDWMVIRLGSAIFAHGVFLPDRLYTTVTAIFVHDGWLHLIANSIWFLVLGPRIQVHLGDARFVAFFLLTGIAGNLAHAFINWGHMSFVIGASGAVFGVLGAGAYVLTRASDGGPPTRKNILHFVVVILILLAGYAAIGDGAVSWEAHAGGFVAGLVFFPLLRRRRPRFPRPTN